MNYQVTHQPSKFRKLSYDEWFENISKGWEYKAKQLQARRWHMFKQAGKGTKDVKSKNTWRAF